VFWRLTLNIYTTISLHGVATETLPSSLQRPSPYTAWYYMWDTIIRTSTNPCYTLHTPAYNNVQWQIKLYWMTISKTYTVRYNSALSAPYNLLQLSYRTTNGITTFTLHCCQYIYQPRILSVYFYIPPGQCKPQSKMALDNEGYCFQLWTKGLANCRGNTGDRIAKELEEDDHWDFFLIPQYTSLNCSAYLKKLTVANLVKNSLLFTE
jgi:hypothetical protein